MHLGSPKLSIHYEKPCLSATSTGLSWSGETQSATQPRMNGVFGREPALAAATDPHLDAGVDGCRAQHARLAGLDREAAFGVVDITGSDLHRAELDVGTVVCAHDQSQPELGASNNGRTVHLVVENRIDASRNEL